MKNLLFSFPYQSDRKRDMREVYEREVDRAPLRYGQIALGGVAPLDGDKLVRVVYLDEGGVSSREPFCVVSAALVNADQSLIVLEDRLDELVRKHIPPEDQRGFIFHATDIWSGSGYFKDKIRWPLSRRLEILDDLVLVPSELRIPIAFGVSWKEILRPQIIEVLSRRSGIMPSEHELENEYHALAYLHCAFGV